MKNPHPELLGKGEGFHMTSHTKHQRLARHEMVAEEGFEPPTYWV